MLQANDIVKRFKKNRVLDGLTLDVQAGAVTVLLGSNGAGKSTLVGLR